MNMDITNSEILTKNTKQQSQPLEQTDKEINAIHDTNELEVKNIICEELENGQVMNDVAVVAQKETIEILKVELVASGIKDSKNESINNGMEEYCEKNEVAKEQVSQKFNCEIMETGGQTTANIELFKDELLASGLEDSHNAKNITTESINIGMMEYCEKNEAINEQSSQNFDSVIMETAGQTITTIEILKEELQASGIKVSNNADNTKNESINIGMVEYCEKNEAIHEQTSQNVHTAIVESAVPTKANIEILKEELLASGIEDSNNDDNSKNESIDIAMEEYCVNNEVAKEQTSKNFDTETVEVNEIEKSDVHVKTAQMEENENISNIANETITCISEAQRPTTTSGLSLLAQYDSGDDMLSDTDSVIEVPTSTQDYRNQVVEIDSDSDSDNSSGTSDVEYLQELRKTIEKRMEVADEDEENEEDNEEFGGKKKRQTKLKVKGEMLLEDLPPIQDLQITVPEDECIELGKIHSIVNQLVLVSVLPNSILLDLETVIFLEKGQKVLGEVFDVLGQVADPLYCVRFNSNKQILEKQINVGDVVYVAPKTQYTQYVILSSLMKLRGSDASWENDVEPPPRFLDYSDDEQEQFAKRQLRNKDRPADNDDPTKRSRTVDVEVDDTASVSSYQSNASLPRNRYNENRNNRGGGRGVRGGAGSFNANNRSRYNGPAQNQQRTPNHHSSSWHSNYYPQTFSPHPAGNYGITQAHHQPQSAQAYPPQVPMYAMPPVHSMLYPPPQPTQYRVPAMLHQHGPQLIPNTFSIRPPTLHGQPPYAPHHHQYTPSPPPPPGLQ